MSYVIPRSSELRDNLHASRPTDHVGRSMVEIKKRLDHLTLFERRRKASSVDKTRRTTTPYLLQLLRLKNSSNHVHS